MTENQLLEDEKIITQSGGGSITLTNHRIRFFEKQSGKAHILSILLDKVASVEIIYKSKSIFWILGILSIIGGLFFWFQEDPEPSWTFLLLGVILVIVYFATRKHFVVITSDGTSKISFQTTGLNTNDLIAFLDKLEKARLTFEKAQR